MNILNCLCEIKPDGTAGKPSFGRVIMALIVVFALGWITSVVTYNLRHNIVPALPEFSGVIGWLTASGGLFYVANKAADAYKSSQNGQNGNGNGKG